MKNCIFTFEHVFIVVKMKKRLIIFSFWSKWKKKHVYLHLTIVAFRPHRSAPRRAVPWRFQSVLCRAEIIRATCRVPCLGTPWRNLAKMIYYTLYTIYYIPYTISLYENVISSFFDPDLCFQTFPAGHICSFSRGIRIWGQNLPNPSMVIRFFTKTDLIIIIIIKTPYFKGVLRPYSSAYSGPYI